MAGTKQETELVQTGGLDDGRGLARVALFRHKRLSFHNLCAKVCVC